MPDKKVIILGAGPTGLSAGYQLTKKGVETIVLEKENYVGGIARTVVKDSFRFDLGGHRFFTKKDELMNFVKDVMGDELVLTPRTSRIYFNGKYFNYPLKPLNALLNLGFVYTLKAMFDYVLMNIKIIFRSPKIVSLEDWVVSQFGRTLFEIFFRPYTEKVWGIKCNQIAAEWAAQRIKGLSLSSAIKNALFKHQKGKPTTLIDEFFYPKLGIGRISERLQEEINKKNGVLLNNNVTRILHKDNKVLSVETATNGNKQIHQGTHFLSTIPFTELILKLDPTPPNDITNAAKSLGYRELVTIHFMINAERVTNDTWIYIQDPNITFGRIHEPKNWSKYMAPEGKTNIVIEYFCFEGDRIWSTEDGELIKLTIDELTEKLCFIDKNLILDAFVVRTKKAYPMYQLGYREPFNKLKEYIKGFSNLQVIGRYGMYKYNNMDHCIETALRAVDNIFGANFDLYEINKEPEYHEIKYSKREDI